MSATESKAKTGRKFSRKSAKAQKAVLFTILAQTVDVSVAMTSLIKPPLNVLTTPYSEESVSELADPINGVGLSQNLAIHALTGTVTAGGCTLPKTLLDSEQWWEK